MRNIFQVLIFSTVASVMFSCSNGDVDLIDLPNDALAKGELKVRINSENIGLNTESDINSEEAIKNLHLFVFKSDKWVKEDYITQTLSDNQDPEVFSSKPSIGTKRFAVVANCETIVGNNGMNGQGGVDFDGNTIADLTGFYATKVHLSSQSVDNLTMVGEQTFEVKKGLNEASINLTRLVAKVVLKSVGVQSDYANTIKIKRAFMMNVNGLSWMRGTSTGDYEYHDPISNGFVDQDSYANGYLAQLSSVFTDPFTTPVFYVFENKGKRYDGSDFKESAKTMLVIEADYTKKDGTSTQVYYSIVVKTGGEEKVIRNNVYTLSATIKRPGSLNPEIPSSTGDLEVSITVDPWETNDEQSESFE